jgi:sugar phosphate isomerase/epimerase
MSTIASGVVAAEYFTKDAGRFISMHIQDIDMNAPAPPLAEPGRGGARGRPQVPLGKGTIDWARTFAPAKAASVRNYFVEQDLELTSRAWPRFVR